MPSLPLSVITDSRRKRGGEVVRAAITETGVSYRQRVGGSGL